MPERGWEHREGWGTKPAFVAAVQTKDRWAQRPWYTKKLGLYSECWDLSVFKGTAHPPKKRENSAFKLKWMKILIQHFRSLTAKRPPKGLLTRNESSRCKCIRVALPISPLLSPHISASLGVTRAQRHVVRHKQACSRTCLPTQLLELPER